MNQVKTSPSAEPLFLQTIFQTISEEKLGFRFGQPERVDELATAAVLPILRDVAGARQYVTFGETEQVHVSDSGVIEKVTLENTSDDHVFLRSGTIFQGKGTQSRTNTRSAVLHPHSKVSIDARCIHQTHAIRMGSKFSFGGFTPYEVERHVYDSGFRPSDQGTYWRSVRNTSGAMNSLFRQESRHFAGALIRHEVIPVSPICEDNLTSHIEEFSQAFDRVLSKVALLDNQAGIALINEHGCQNVEVFDLPGSWAALHKDAVSRMGTELLRTPKKSVFEFKPEHARDVVREVLGLKWKQETIFEHKAKDEELGVRITGLTANGHVGEVVELNRQVIHLMVLKKAD